MKAMGRAARQTFYVGLDGTVIANGQGTFEGKMPSLRRNHFERRSERGRPALELATRARVGFNHLECGSMRTSVTLRAPRRRQSCGLQPFSALAVGHSRTSSSYMARSFS